MASILQKKKAADLLHRIGGSSDFDFSVVKGVLDEVEALEGKIPHIDLLPLQDAVKRLEDQLRMRTMAIGTLAESVEKLKNTVKEEIGASENRVKKESLRELDEAIKKLSKDIEETRGDFKRLPRGGGNMSRDLTIAAVQPSLHFKDWNFQAGTGMTISYADNAVTRHVDVTFTSTATGGGDNALNETPSGTIDGANTAFTLAHTPVANTLKLYLNGAFQAENEDYTLSGTTITFFFAPSSPSVLRAFYTYL